MTTEPATYPGYRFPAEIIRHAVWLYLRPDDEHLDVGYGVSAIPTAGGDVPTDVEEGEAALPALSR